MGGSYSATAQNPNSAVRLSLSFLVVPKSKFLGAALS